MEQLLTLIELEHLLGESVRKIRLLKNLDRKTVCERAGVSLNALKNLESGKGATIKTLLLVVRALGRIDWINNLAPQISINPLHMVRGKPTRQRARRKQTRINNDNQKS